MALLIGAPTVPASERQLFVSHECFFFQQAWFTDRRARLHIFGSRWLQKARPGSFGSFLSAMSSRNRLCVSSRGSRKEAGVDKVSHYLYGNQCSWPPKHFSF